MANGKWSMVDGERATQAGLITRPLLAMLEEEDSLPDLFMNDADYFRPDASERTDTSCAGSFVGGLHTFRTHT
jgi:hypothetical protein